MNYDSILIKRFILQHSRLAARACEDIEPGKLAGFFNESPNEWLLELIPHMNPLWLSEVYKKMNPERLASLLEIMEINLLAVAIRMMHEDLGESMLNRLSDEKSTSVKKLLQYMDQSVGAHMDPAVFTLEENLTVEDAVSAIKRHNEPVDPQLFVTGPGRILVGAINLSDLITREPGMEIRSLMMTSMLTLSPETPIQSLLNHKEWQNFYVLPVVDHTSFFLGAIRLEKLRSIQARSDNKGGEMDQLTISALGDLYRIGLAGLLRSATNLAEPSFKE